MKTKPQILLVDDDEHLLITMRDYLTFEGFDVREARTGQEALEKIDAAAPDLIILDISMPQMSGLTFLKEMPAEEERPKYPVLVLTARAAMEEFFGNMPIDGFLAKPCPLDQLVQAIRHILAVRVGSDDGLPQEKVMILLGEDNAGTAGAIETHFAEYGYGVESVRHGAEILERAVSMQPSAILVKEALLGMSGSRVASILASMTGTRDIPVVLYDESMVYEEDRHYGMRTPTGVKKLTSSAEPAVLLSSVRTVMEQR